MKAIEIRQVDAIGCRDMFEVARGKQFLVQNFATEKVRFASEKQLTIDDITRWDTIADAVAVLAKMFPEKEEGGRA